MKGRNLVILVILAVVLVAIAVISSKKDSKSTPSAIGRALFPNLIADDVGKIVVSSTEGTATVTRANDIWTVPDRYNYPANFSKVKDCVLKLADMKIGQVMKLDGKQKAEMKLAPPAGSQSKNTGTLLDLQGKNNAVIASLLIGEARMRKPGGDMPDYGGYPDGHYVSPDNGINVYLVNSALSDLPLNAKNWLDQELLNVPSSDIKAISITGPDRKDIRLEKKKEGSGFELAGLATNEVTAESKMYGLESAISYLNLEDVANPETKPELSGLDKPAIFTATTQKGEIYTVRIGKKQDATDYRYCKIEVALTGTEKPAEPKDDSEKKKAEQAAKDRKELEDKIKALNEKLSKWIYLVNSQKADAMTPAHETLIEKKKEESKTTTGATAPAAQGEVKDDLSSK